MEEARNRAGQSVKRGYARGDVLLTNDDCLMTVLVRVLLRARIEMIGPFGEGGGGGRGRGIFINDDVQLPMMRVYRFDTCVFVNVKTLFTLAICRRSKLRGGFFFFFHFAKTTLSNK